MLFATNDQKCELCKAVLKARVGYDNIPTELHSLDSGSAIWFHDVNGLQLRVALPEGFHYVFNVRVLSAPDFFLNEFGRPEPYPPSEDGETILFDYTVVRMVDFSHRPSSTIPEDPR